MAITSAGLQKLRETVADWGYIAITDDNGAEVFRIPTSDNRVTISSDATENPYQIQVLITGSDSEIVVDSTVIQGIELYDVDSGGSALVEHVYSNSFDFPNSQDNVTFELSINIEDLT